MKINCRYVCWLAVMMGVLLVAQGFRPTPAARPIIRDSSPTHSRLDDRHGVFQPMDDTFFDRHGKSLQPGGASLASVTAVAAGVATVVVTTPAPASATAAGPVPSALMAWAHFLGLVGVAGGLVTERFLVKPGLTLQDERRLNDADGIYGLSALSLLVSGYFRVTEYAKGWDFYKNEPIFWVKMSSVAVLGGLSFFPAIVFFRRDQARRQGKTLAPLSDALVDRLTRIINAELLALITIPLFGSLMARGVLYMEDFPWALGVALYAVSLGGAGFKYGSEAFQMMEAEGALSEIDAGPESD